MVSKNNSADAEAAAATAADDENAPMEIKYLQLSKQLAHTEKRQRDKAVRSIRQSLTHVQQEIPRLDMMKLWKGLFYCMWMSDKPLVQQELASALAKIAVEFENQQNTLGYLQAFWMTMAREWHGIDYLRLDKFYFLCRQMITGTLKWLRSNQWSPELIRQCNRLLSAKENYGPLSATDESKRVPMALCYHFCEYYTSLLHQLLEEEQQQLSIECIELLIEPLVALGCRTDSKIVLMKLKEHFSDFLLSIGSEVCGDSGSGEIVGLDSRLIGRLLWQRVSKDQTVATANRKLFYETVNRISEQFGTDVTTTVPTCTPVLSLPATKANKQMATSKQNKEQQQQQQKIIDENIVPPNTPKSSVKTETAVTTENPPSSAVINSDCSGKSVRWTVKSRVKVFNNKLPVSRSPSPIVGGKQPAKGLLKKPFQKPLILENFASMPKKPRLEFLELPQSPAKKTGNNNNNNRNQAKQRQKQQQQQQQRQQQQKQKENQQETSRRMSAADFM